MVFFNYCQFGIEDRIGFSHTEQWMVTHCPNIFSGVHSWVYMVLSGSNLPSEMVSDTYLKLLYGNIENV